MKRLLLIFTGAAVFALAAGAAFAEEVNGSGDWVIVAEQPGTGGTGGGTATDTSTANGGQITAQATVGGQGTGGTYGSNTTTGTGTTTTPGAQTPSGTSGAGTGAGPGNQRRTPSGSTRAPGERTMGGGTVGAGTGGGPGTQGQYGQYGQYGRGAGYGAGGRTTMPRAGLGIGWVAVVGAAVAIYGYVVGRRSRRRPMSGTPRQTD